MVEPRGIKPLHDTQINAIRTFRDIDRSVTRNDPRRNISSWFKFRVVVRVPSEKNKEYPFLKAEYDRLGSIKQQHLDHIDYKPWDRCPDEDVRFLCLHTGALLKEDPGFANHTAEEFVERLQEFNKQVNEGARMEALRIDSVCYLPLIETPIYQQWEFNRDDRYRPTKPLLCGIFEWSADNDPIRVFTNGYGAAGSSPIVDLYANPRKACVEAWNKEHPILPISYAQVVGGTMSGYKVKELWAQAAVGALSSGVSAKKAARQADRMMVEFGRRFPEDL